jgi:hypothetical protein
MQLVELGLQMRDVSKGLLEAQVSRYIREDVRGMCLRILSVIRYQETDKFLLRSKDHTEFPKLFKLVAEREQREFVYGQGCIWDLIQEVVSSSILHDLSRILWKEVRRRDVVWNYARRTAVAAFRDEGKAMHNCKGVSRGIRGVTSGRSSGRS